MGIGLGIEERHMELVF